MLPIENMYFPLNAGAGDAPLVELYQHNIMITSSSYNFLINTFIINDSAKAFTVEEFITFLNKYKFNQYYDQTYLAVGGCRTNNSDIYGIKAYSSGAIFTLSFYSENGVYSVNKYTTYSKTEMVITDTIIKIL